jgi:HK97 family phage major capsid protein
MPPFLSDLTAARAHDLNVRDLMRVLCAKTFGSGDAIGYYLARWENTDPEKNWPLVRARFDALTTYGDTLRTKAAIGPGTTTDPTWAKPLVTPAMVGGFLALLRATSVLGKIPFTAAPFNTKLAAQTAGASSTWVTESSVKPITKLGFANVTLPIAKCQSIVVVTAELMRLAAPNSEGLLATTIRDEVVTFTDATLLSTSAVAGAPPGILNGITPVTDTGSLAGNLTALVAKFFTDRPQPIAPVVICSSAVASKIAALDLGRDVTVNGGTLLGLPVAVSPGAGANVIALDAPALFVADEGVDLDVSTQAAIEMTDAPTGTAASVVTSLYQANLAGIRAERFIYWALAIPTAVQYMVTT